ncbi:VRR-NUC domain-containing protein [Ruegeria sp.]|uniref:VRR-NUC domain-containing protein n=1 Tax=Ruegeria sp. TaxID=1879320 RepID=UPI003B5C0183
MPNACRHLTVECLNEYELIRKYRCNDCGEVMMCACNEEFGNRFLSHQLEQGVELETQARIKVTIGFRPNVCNECRGLPLVAAPTAAIPGRTSKIKRFYWRELFFMVTERAEKWVLENPDAAETEIQEKRNSVEKEVLAELKELHATAPKYDMRESSQAEIIARYNVKVQPFYPDYVEKPQKGAVVLLEGEAISPESFVAREFASDGWSSMELESTPLHALFGVMMWQLLSTDDEAQLVEFGSRTALDTGKPTFPIRTFLSQDFGTRTYGARRKKEIDEHFALLMSDNKPDREYLLELFDYWRGHSRDLREYLWAHRDPDVDKARQLIERLSPESILIILRYLIEDYWGRFVGWPDLLLWKGDEVLMIEVKSSSDKLSAEQKRWIADNATRLKFPFRIAKLHRKSRN